MPARQLDSFAASLQRLQPVATNSLFFAPTALHTWVLLYIKATAVLDIKDVLSHYAGHADISPAVEGRKSTSAAELSSVLTTDLPSLLSASLLLMCAGGDDLVSFCQ